VTYKIIYQDYSYTPKGLSIVPKTLANFLERIAQLFEQGFRFVHEVHTNSRVKNLTVFRPCGPQMV